MSSSDINQSGTLIIKLGPMFSGKSTWLRFKLTELADQEFSVCLVVHASDVRSDVSVSDLAGSTHNSTYKSLSPKITVFVTSDLMSVTEQIKDFHVVGIDESQFFPDLRDTVEFWINDLKKYIFVVGLDGDSSMQKFGQTLDLIPLCDKVSKIVSRCKICLAELKAVDFKNNPFNIRAPFTKRIVDSGPQVAIGGSNMYIPTCRFHHSTTV